MVGDYPYFYFMKRLNFWLVAFCCLITSSLFAQTPKQIDADLLNIYKRIDYWRILRNSNDTTFNPFQKYDSIKSANRHFAERLKLYIEKYPATICYPLKCLQKEYFLHILKSSDNMLKIYSWDTWTGSGAGFFETVTEYKSSSDYKVIIDSTKKLGDNRPNYRKLFTFIANDKTYYLVVYLYINDELEWEEGIRIYNIEDGKLTESKLIKTNSDLYSNLSYKVHSYSWGRPKIRFNIKKKTIYLPLVNEKRHFMHKRALYKFTGQYFERVKN